MRVASSGLNRADLLQRRGRYPVLPGYPEDIPGLELAGTVASVGKDVTGVAVGDQVMGILGGGGYAEYALSPAETLVPIPTGTDPVVAGAIPEVYMTAYDAAFLQEGLEGARRCSCTPSGAVWGTPRCNWLAGSAPPSSGPRGLPRSWRVRPSSASTTRCSPMSSGPRACSS